MAKLPDFTDLGVATGTDIQDVPSLKMPSVYEDPMGKAEIGFAKELKSVSNDIYKLYEKQKEELDQTAVANAKNKALQLAMQLKYDPKEGALNKLGQDAVTPDYVSGNLQKLHDGLEAISNELTPEQKAKFNIYSSAISTDTESDLYKHSGEQFKVYQNATDKASVQTYMQSGATEAMSPSPNPKNMEASLAGIDETITRILDRSGQAFTDGQPTEILKAAIQQAHGDFWQASIEAAMGADQINNAKGMFYSHMKELDPKTVKVLGNTLNAVDKENALRITAQEAGDYVMAKGMDETSALDYARDKYSGNEEAAAVAEIYDRFNKSKIVKANHDKQVADMAWKIIASGGGRKQIPAIVWGSLDGKEQTQIEDYLHNKAKQAEAEAKARAEGKEIKSDTASYYTLKKFAVNDPQRFVQTNLLSLPEFSKLSRADQQEIITLQSSVAQKKPGELKSVRTLDNQVAVSVAETGLKDKNQKAIAEGKIREAIDAEAIARGKELNADERQKIIDKMLIEGEVLSGKWYAPDPNKRLFEVVGTEAETRFVPEIPDTERQKIETALRRAKKPVTNDAVMKLYKLKNGL